MFLFWVQDSRLISRATKPHGEKSKNIHFKYLLSQYLPIRLGRLGNIEYFCNVFGDLENVVKVVNNRYEMSEIPGPILSRYGWD